MKKCPYCGAEYRDDAVACAVDHTSLDKTSPLPLSAAQLLSVRRQGAFMKRVLFVICGLCWIGFGIAAGAFAYRCLLVGGDSQSSILQILAPASAGSVLVGLIHTVGFCALYVLCFVVGISLCSYSFEPRSDH